MQYIGSKNRLSKELVPLIQSYINKDTGGYLEPFVGGANMIDKIQHHNKIGADSHKELIALLSHAQNTLNVIPEDITREQYNEVKDNRGDFPDWYVGLVGFCSSFGSKYFGGYAYDPRYEKRGSNGSAVKSAIKNLQNQRPQLSNINFTHADFRNFTAKDIRGYVIYCDPPYRGTTKYKTEEFPYEEFYQWCREMSTYNTVLISEYNMPDDFRYIWQKDAKVLLGQSINKDSVNSKTEKLFVYGN